MPLAQSSNRHPRTTAIPPWLIPFFPPQKRRIASFLQAINLGISTPPTALVILQWNTPIGGVPDAAASDNGVHSWPCPPISPRSARKSVPLPPLWGEDGAPNESRALTRDNNPTRTLHDRFRTKSPSFATPPLATHHSPSHP